jgi:hypothetical protein
LACIILANETPLVSSDAWGQNRHLDIAFGGYPCHARDWKLCFDPTPFKKGAESGFGEQVLHAQKSLKKSLGTHFDLWIKDLPTRQFGGGPLPLNITTTPYGRLAFSSGPIGQIIKDYIRFLDSKVFLFQVARLQLDRDSGMQVMDRWVYDSDLRIARACADAVAYILMV